MKMGGERVGRGGGVPTRRVWAGTKPVRERGGAQYIGTYNHYANFIGMTPK